MPSHFSWIPVKENGILTNIQMHIDCTNMSRACDPVTLTTTQKESEMESETSSRDEKPYDIDISTID